MNSDFGEFFNDEFNVDNFRCVGESGDSAEDPDEVFGIVIIGECVSEEAGEGLMFGDQHFHRADEAVVEHPCCHDIWPIFSEIDVGLGE